MRSITKYYKTTKLAGMTYHLINKAVMKQNCIEALNQHAQLLERKLPSRISPETLPIHRPRPLRNKTAEQLIGPSDYTEIG